MRMMPLIMLLASCGKAPKPEPMPISPSPEVRQDYDQTSSRLTSRFLDRGMVISLGKDGHRGDSLLWSGLALGSLPCGAESPVRAGLQTLIADLNGGLARFPDLPHDISLDGATGFYTGLAQRLRRCPEEKASWKDTVALLKAYMDGHKGAINDNGFVIPPEFDLLPMALFHSFDLSGVPDSRKLPALAFEVATWANVVKEEHAACYRAHIGWLALKGLEDLGYSFEKSGVCNATSGLQLAVIDHWCGRDGLKDFLDGFQYNQWEYKHQRCPAWESPDGDGLETPAVDRLIALTMYYQL